MAFSGLSFWFNSKTEEKQQLTESKQSHSYLVALKQAVEAKEINIEKIGNIICHPEFDIHCPDLNDKDFHCWIELISNINQPSLFNSLFILLIAYGNSVVG